MAYFLAAIAGGGYAVALRYLAEKFNLCVVALLSIALFLAVSIGWKVEDTFVSVLNAVGFFVWLCFPVVGIYFVSNIRNKAFSKNWVLASVGAFCWAGFTQVSRFLGYVFGT